VVKTRLTTKGKGSVRKEEIIYMLPEAGHPKAGQIGLAGQVGLAEQIGLAGQIGLVGQIGLAFP
jgi:hypothetical protein